MKRAIQIPSACPGSELVFAADRPWLAPLAGYSDLPFRLLCRERGAAVCVTEMISARGLCYPGSRTPELLASCPEDQPLVVQLFGGEKESLVQSVRLLRSLGYRNLDFNMGCPVKKVWRQKAGAWLLGEPGTALEIARAMIKEAKSAGGHEEAKIGFKMRLGPSPGKSPLPDLALALEDAGADWIALHPRWASQGYSGSADWESIQRLAEKLSVPLIASGDLLDARAGLACLNLTGAAGVMYARGALRDPAIFSDHLDLCVGRPVRERRQEDIIILLLRHLHFARVFGSGRSAFTKLRSIVPRYARSFRGSQELRHKLGLCADWDSLEALIIKEALSLEKEGGGK